LRDLGRNAYVSILIRVSLRRVGFHVYYAEQVQEEEEWGNELCSQVA
jgi:hypothetical protein